MLVLVSNGVPLALVATWPLVLQVILFFVARSSARRAPLAGYLSAGLFLLLFLSTLVLNPLGAIGVFNFMAVAVSVFLIREGRRFNAMLR